jgi:arylsulfatase A-like enzyme
VISEQSTGYPGYNSIIEQGQGDDRPDPARQRLQHLVVRQGPQRARVPGSQAGPFDQWPTGMGFEYFYGFVGGDANQWQPNLFRNTTQIYPFDGRRGWNLVTAMADDAIDWITDMHQIDPSKPFFVKYAPGATHAPHHPTKEWVDKIARMNLFDDGYEALRETIFENQKRSACPRGRDADALACGHLKPWDQLTDDEKKLFIRQVEVFAAYAAYSDHEIGRVIQAIDDIGKLDDTLIIYINGDNGTSAEGGPLGTPNEVAFFNGAEQDPGRDADEVVRRLGHRETYNHMSAGWSWAFDTPFDWFKQNASRSAASARTWSSPGRRGSPTRAACATSSCT